MSDAEIHRLPEWFERPSPKKKSTQRSLFTTSLHEVVLSLRVSIDEVNRWKQRGWLTCDVSTDSEIDLFDDPIIYEVGFIRNLARSGLSDSHIECLLSQLPNPYSFDPDRIAYSFRHGWVVAAHLEATDPDEIIEGNLDAWIDDRDEGELRELAGRIELQIQSLVNDDLADEQDDSPS